MIMEIMALEVLSTITRWLDGGHQTRLVAVVKTWGSSPRPVGSMLGVRSDETLVGSVSGWCVEDDLIERVRSDAIASQLPRVLTYSVTQTERRRFGMTWCGTLQQVVEPLDSADDLHRIVENIEQGHIVSHRLQIQTGLADIRPAIHDQGFSFDGEVLVRGMLDDVFREMRPDRRTAIVCLSHDPKLDDVVLLESLISDAFYVGAIGSQSNTERCWARLALFDIGEEQLASLHGPVGLPIGSKTSPEIAVSILAEVIAVKHGVGPEYHGAMPRTTCHSLEAIT
jgi:xanthine dehydrogenase accessory factor